MLELVFAVIASVARQRGLYSTVVESNTSGLVGAALYGEVAAPNYVSRQLLRDVVRGGARDLALGQ